MERFKECAPPLSSFLLFFFFIVLLRTFLETIYSNYGLEVKSFFHIFLSFLWVATSIMVVTKLFFLDENVEIIAKVIFSAMGIILLPPIIDLILSGGKGLYMTYYTQALGPKNLPGFWEGYFTFFGSYKGFGATPGIKFELVLGMLLAFTFSHFYKNKNAIISALYSLSVYLVVVILGFFPYLFTLLFSQFNLVFHYDHEVLGIFFLVITVFNFLILFAFQRPIHFKYLLKALIGSEVYWLFLMGILGVTFVNNKIDLSQEYIVRTILSGLAMIFAVVNSIIRREIYFNKEGHISLGDFRSYAGITLAISVGLAAYVSFLALFFIAIFLLGKFLRFSNLLEIKPFYLLLQLTYCFGPVAIMSLGRETFFPYSFPELNLILIIFFLNLILVSLKKNKIFNTNFLFP